MEKIKIILADDHTIFREGLSELLKQSGKVDVIGEASSGLEVIDLVLKKKPDVVLMDVSMPKMNGLVAMAKIKDLIPGIKILILSMYSNQQYIDEALANGASGYVMKDAAGAELLTAIDTIIEGKTYLSSTVASQVARQYMDMKAQPGSILTQREMEVLKLLALGRTNKEISEILYISVKTVETHRKNLMTKLDVRNLADLVRYAVKNNIITI